MPLSLPLLLPSHPLTSLNTFCFEEECTDPASKHHHRCFQDDILMCSISEAVFCQKSKKVAVGPTDISKTVKTAKLTVPGKKSPNLFSCTGFMCYLKAWGKHIVFGQDI